MHAKSIYWLHVTVHVLLMFFYAITLQETNLTIHPKNPIQNFIVNSEFSEELMMMLTVLHVTDKSLSISDSLIELQS